MTKTEAKAYVCRCAAIILDHGGINTWLEGREGASDRDRERIKEAFRELVIELERRGKRCIMG